MVAPIIDILKDDSDLTMHTHTEADLGATLDSRYLNTTSNLSDLENVTTARTNLGLVAGGTGDIWVEKAGDTMTGALVITPSANGTSILNVTDATGTSVLNVDGTSANVGIGTTSPGAKLDIVTGATGTIGQIIKANYYSQTADLSRWTSHLGGKYLWVDGNFKLTYSNISTKLSDAPIESTQYLYSDQVYATGIYTNTSIITAQSGVVSGVVSLVSGNAYAVQGLQFQAACTTATEASGVNGLVTLSGVGGAVTRAYGSNVTVQTTNPAVSYAFGYSTGRVSVSGSGSIGVYKAFDVGSPYITGSGAITTNYGLFIDDQTGATNNYAILTKAGNIVFNEGGDSATDFRVESDTEANMLFLDANADTDGALYLGGTTNGIKINKGGVLTFLGTANISGGATGSFTTTDGKTVTVTGGIITAIV